MANKKRKISRSMVILVLGLALLAIVAAIFFASPSKVDYMLVSDDASDNYYYTSVTKKNGDSFDSAELKKLTKIRFDNTNSGACNLYKDYSEKTDISVTPYPEQYAKEIVKGKSLNDNIILQETEMDNHFIIKSAKSKIGEKEILFSCRGMKEILKVNVLSSVKKININKGEIYVREGRSCSAVYSVKMEKGKDIKLLKKGKFKCKVVKGNKNITIKNNPSLSEKGKGKIRISADSPGTAVIAISIGGCVNKITITVEAKPVPKPKETNDSYSNNNYYNNNNNNNNYNNNNYYNNNNPYNNNNGKNNSNNGKSKNRKNNNPYE